MAFVVEDGTAPVGANSYVPVSFADTYFADRGDTVWDSLSNVDKQFALIKATDYIDRRFGTQFSGFQHYREQELQWPREGACKTNGWWLQSNEIPKELKYATCEYAMQAALLGSLVAEAPTTASESPKIAETIKVGPITVSERFSDTASKTRVSGIDVVSDSTLPEYPAADLWLQNLLGSPFETDLIRG